MKSISSDPLLGFAKIILYVLLGVIAIAGAGLTLGVAALLLYATGALSGFTDVAMTTGQALSGVVLIAAIIGVLVLAWLFINHMLAIVRSVESGDPFIPENADRLTAMAWITLAAQIMTLPVAGFAVWLAQTLGEEPGTVDAGFDFGGITLILTLFILARVFRHGTSLREDLEGTV